MSEERDQTVTVRKQVLLLVVISAALLLSGNGVLPLVDRDEPRFAEASREMLERSDLIIPWFNGNYRFDKPPLIYWCQMVSYAVFGENRFAARLPSALFGVATVILIYLFGSRLRHRDVGFWAGLMFVTCVQSLVYGRLAIADMAMIFFVTASAWAGWELCRRRLDHRPPKRGVWAAFYGSLALGFLAKGPVTWLPLAGILWLSFRRPQLWDRRQFKLIPGSIFVLIAVGLWGVPALVLTKGEFFNVGIGKHVVGRSFSVMEGHGAKNLIGYLATLPIYFLLYFVSFFPWAFLSVVPLRRWWNDRREDRDGTFLVLQAFLFFLVFSVSKTKLPHYTWPAFPFVALFVARAAHLDGPNLRRRFGKWLVGMTVFGMLVTTVGFSLAAPRFATAALLDKARPHLRADMKLGTLDYEEPSVVWGFRGVLDAKLQHVHKDTVRDWLALNPRAVLVARTATMKAALPEVPDDATMFHVSGLNVAKWKGVELTVLIQDSSDPGL